MSAVTKLKDISPWKKSYDKLRQYIKKQRPYFAIHLVKAMVFPLAMYGCESWTIKETEQQRTDAFELWCGRRLLRVPWTARRSNQSILKDQSWIFIERADVEAETLVLWPPDVKNWLIGKDPDAGKDWRQEEGTTGWDGWMAFLTQWTWAWVNSRRW